MDSHSSDYYDDSDYFESNYDYDDDDAITNDVVLQYRNASSCKVIILIYSSFLM